MERVHVERVERKLKSVDQHIREAEERRGRGDPQAGAELSHLRGAREIEKRSIRTANNEDYIDNRNRRRAQRNKLEKFIDTVTCER